MTTSFSSSFSDRVLDVIEDAVLVINRKGVVIFANREAETLFRAGPQVLVSKHFNTLFDEPLNGIDLAAFHRPKKEITKAILVTPQPYHFQAKREDNSTFAATLRVYAGLDPEHPKHLTGIIRPVSAEEELSQELQRLTYLSTHDTLTNLPNRRILTEWISNLIGSRKLNPEDNFGVLFIDVDDFKSINDTYGHVAGDAILSTLASRLNSITRAGDILVRYGGDEFVMACQKISSQEELQQIADRLTSVAERPIAFKPDSPAISIKVSVGGTISPKGHTSAAELLETADTSLYVAKRNGGNQSVVTSQSEQEASSTLPSGEALLQSLHQENENDIYVHYQPIIDVKTRKTVGFEALARWHFNGDCLRPAQFVPIAEEYGIVNELDAWMLKQSCLALNTFREKFGDSLYMAVNLSVKHFESFVEPSTEIAKVLSEHQIPPHLLALELTESARLLDRKGIKQDLQRIRDLGCKVFLDDFGTGYASLTYLMDFPANAVKIDRSFIRRISQSDQKTAKAVVAGITETCSRLGIDTIAEGVELAEIHREINDLGIAYGQGYFYSRPLSLDKAIQFYTDELSREDSTVNTAEIPQTL